MDELAQLRKQVEETKWLINQNTLKYNLDRVAELQYEKLPKLERRIAQLVSELEEPPMSAESNENATSTTTTMMTCEGDDQEGACSTEESVSTASSSSSSSLAKARTARKRMLSEAVGVEEIAEIVSRWTGIPVTKLSQNEKSKLLHLADALHRRVIGQVSLFRRSS